MLREGGQRCLEKCVFCLEPWLNMWIFLIFIIFLPNCGGGRCFPNVFWKFCDYIKHNKFFDKTKNPHNLQAEILVSIKFYTHLVTLVLKIMSVKINRGEVIKIGVRVTILRHTELRQPDNLLQFASFSKQFWTAISIIP